MQDPRNRKYQSLDLWRGLAAIWVVLFHDLSSIEADSGLRLNHNVFANICRWGDAGVVLFFVISGYCIAVAAVNTIERNQPVKQFALARIRRIFPPHWVVLLLFILMSGVAWFAQQRGIINNSNLAERFTLLNPWAIATNAALLQVPLKQDSINIVAWTLCYEIAFYAVMGVGVALFYKQGWQRMCKALHVLTVLSFCVVSFVPRWAIFPFNLWANFGVGVLLFDVLCGEVWAARSNRGRLFYCGTLVTIVSLTVFQVMHDPTNRSVWQSAMAVPFAALLCYLHPLDKKLSETKWLRGLFRVGTFSYSLYLTHFLVVAILRQLARKVPVPVSLFALEMIVVTAISIVFAYVFYLLVESRFIRTKPVMPKAVPAMPLQVRG